MTDPIRLNLGPGESPIPGYVNLDIKDGQPAYPLKDYADNSVDEVRASHLLEHFGSAFTQQVLDEWVRVLKPGGRLKIAVPDMEVIAEKFMRGDPGQYQGWIYGGQMDKHDVHHALFDFDRLSEFLRKAGLAGIHYWGLPGEQDPDSSCLEVSLNLAGYKKPAKWPYTEAIQSRPRLGWQDHFGSCLDALYPLGMQLFHRGGAYWGVSMAKAMEDAMATGCEYLLTLDYDTVFRREDVEDLLSLMIANPEADALSSVQQSRADDKILLNVEPTDLGNGQQQQLVSFDQLDQTYLKAKCAHFGMTLVRTSALKKLPKPWFQHSYKPDGSYHNYEDIEFWLKFRDAGLKLFLAPRVVVGHLEVVVMWPDRKLKTLFQRTDDYYRNGKPKGAWR